MTLTWSLVLALGALAAQAVLPAPTMLAAPAVAKLVASLDASRKHTSHVWRDTPAFNPDGTINGYIEIAMGDRRKWELDMAANARAIDRMLPESIGGYPINYGFVPQTVSYDGDPFDVLVLGPAIEGGSMVRGVPVGVMFMEDGHIIDSKIVISRLDDRGRPLHQITESIQREVSRFFNRYKQHEPGASTNVPGWGSREQGLELVRVTHAFFLQCRKNTGSACVLSRPK